MQSLVFSQMEQGTEKAVQQLLPTVSAQRRETALRFKHLTGQYACLKSYKMLAQLLAEHYGIPDGTPLLFDHNEHGKPSLRDYPDIYFNLSHCPKAIAVVTDLQPVGIDVERFVFPRPSLLRYTMDDEEVRQVEQAEHPEEVFARLWTRKEALFKYLGTGIRDNIQGLLEETPPEVKLDTTLDTLHGYALTIAHRKKTVEVVAAIVIQENTLLATQRGYGEWKGWWEFPGGKPEAGERLEDALQRELREEMEAEIVVGRKVTTIQYNYADFHLTMHCYLCTIKENRYILREHLAARWLHAEELEDVNWLPADRQLIPLLRNLLT